MLLYQKIMNQMIWEMKADKYPVGQALPGERDLARRFSVSQKTIHNAMLNLVRRGYVESRHGSGNYVLSCSPGHVNDRIAIIMNCSEQKNSDAFFAMDTFMNQLTAIHAFLRQRGFASRLLIYHSDQSLTKQMLDLHSSDYFLNLFFTATPALAGRIVKNGGMLLSTITSFHQSRFSKMYAGMPCVINDYLPGIADAFSFYRKNGIRNFVFFAQGNMGKENYGLYAAEAEKQHVKLQNCCFSLKNREEGNLYSVRRVKFFRQKLRGLPENTVIFSDGLYHIVELFHALRENGEEAVFRKHQYCITGEQSYLLRGLHDGISWIPAHPEKTATMAAKILLDNLLEGKAIPSYTAIKSEFIPAEITV